jgi:DNA-binding response OmpR family regulator
MTVFSQMNKYGFTRQEQKLFDLLESSNGEPVDRFEICEILQVDKKSRTVDTNISNLRKKIAGEYSILNCHGFGYVMGLKSDA